MTATEGSGITIMRWLAVLPGALSATWLAWLFASFMGRLVIWLSGSGLASVIGTYTFTSGGQLLAGMAFVYVGAKIAPAHQKRVAYSLAGLGLVTSGFLLFPAIQIGSGWAIWGGICTIIGIAIVTAVIHNGGVGIADDDAA